MKYHLKTLHDLDVRGKKILFRAGYDITLKNEHGKLVVPDDTRIRATLPTINYLLAQGSSLGFLSWLKRPDGKIVEDFRMKPIAERLSQLLNRPVETLSDCVGAKIEGRIRSMKPGDLVMLENVRFHPEEIHEDLEFAKALTAGFDMIVFDAFSAAHRVHSSTTGILRYLPAVSGLLFEKELQILSELTENPERPFVVVMGGAKISDELGAIKKLAETADKFLIGGALANLFFSAQGIDIGKSFVEDVFVDSAKREKLNWREVARDLINKYHEKIILPVDMMAALDKESKSGIVREFSKNDKLDKNMAYYDIGPKTIQKFSEIIATARTVFFNGPMGIFENPTFASGTKQVAEAIIKSGAVSVLGGGDTESIVEQYGWEGKFSHVSTGGGASLELLAGSEFPVLQYLKK